MENANELYYRAKQFHDELYGSFDSLAQIGEDEGVLTLADIIYLSGAILAGDGSYVDSSSSNIKDVVKELPSASLWMSFLHDGPLPAPKARS